MEKIKKIIDEIEEKEKMLGGYIIGCYYNESKRTLKKIIDLKKKILRIISKEIKENEKILRKV